MTIANIITIFRLLTVPVIVYSAITGLYQFAFWLFILSGVSDAVDGFIAKHFDQQSELGAYLDPIADKALLASLFVTLAIQELIPVWLTVLVVSRDLFILAGVGVAALMGNPIDIDPLRVSKFNTAGQIILVGGVLATIAWDLQTAPLILIGTALVAGLTAASAIAYLLTWVRHLSGPQH